MEHLSAEEIIQFVSIRELNDETFKIAERVGEHVKVCPECFEKVRAFKLLDNKFEDMFKERQAEALKEEQESQVSQSESEELKVENESEEGKLEKPKLTLEMGRNYGGIDFGGNGFGF